MSASTSAACLISTIPELESFISSIPPSTTLYVDLEGKKLCRDGTISLITILLHPERVVKLIDVFALGEAAFKTVSNDGTGRSLKSIFEDPNMPKCFWDVRNDADALWALYKVGLAWVVDVQLLENASRAGDKTYLHGLEKAIRSDLRPQSREINRWASCKREMTSLMSSAGDVFAVRPLNAKTIQYCTNDVVLLPGLHQFYLKRISPDWLRKAQEESSRRVDEAHSPGYIPRSDSKKLGPWGSGSNRHVLSEAEWEDYMDEQRARDMERDMFGHPDDDFELWPQSDEF